jgi:glycosyltransferase involved in cell wall biosynthesis
LDEMELLQNNGHEAAIFTRNFGKNLDSKYSLFFPPDLPLNLCFRSITRATFISKELIYSHTTKRYLERSIDVFRPDIAHAHNIYGRLTTSVLDTLRKHSIPVLLTLHDYKLICPSYKLMRNGRVCEDCRGRRFYMAALNRCHKDSYLASMVYALETAFNEFLRKYKKNVDYFISPSKFLREKLIEFGMDGEKIIHIPNFINLNEHEPNYNYDHYLVYFGRISAEKGIDTLIDAFLILRPKDIKLFIVGDGPLKDEMERKVEKLNSRGIKFTGYLAGDSLRQIIQNGLVVILPSQWYENAPMSVLEAFACGKPVIGTNIGGITEMIDDGIDGYLFEAGNSRDLAEKMDLLLSRTQKDLAQMGMLARKKVEEKYSADAHYQRLISLYNKVLK